MKDEAVANAQRAVDLLDKSSPHRKFAASLLAAAKALECKAEERIETRAAVVPAVRYSVGDRASFNAGVTRDEFLEFARRFKGHEWLTVSPLAVDLPSRSGCLGLVALVGAGLVAASSMALLWLTNG